MPELPEMEIVARRLSEALPGERIESVLTPGINVLKTFDPPLHSIEGGTFTGVRRRGKLLLLDLDTAAGEPLTRPVQPGEQVGRVIRRGAGHPLHRRLVGQQHRAHRRALLRAVDVPRGRGDRDQGLELAHGAPRDLGRPCLHPRVHGRAG